MKKSKKIVVIIITIILILVGIYKISGVEERIMFELYEPTRVEKFTNYKEDYKIIADKIFELKNEKKISNEKSYVIVEKGMMYNAGTFEEIELTKDEKNSLLNIDKSFVDKHSPVGTIEIYDDNYVTFFNTDFLFSIVYSKDGKKPSKFGSNNKKKYKVKKLTSNWFLIETEF